MPQASFIVSQFEDPLPDGPFDVVVSAFAIHRLDAGQKKALFRRISNLLVAGGCFAMLDVVIPEEPVDDPIALEPGVDMPSSTH